MKTKFIRLDTHEEFLAAVHDVVSLLREGAVVGLPTETVYGLGAHALDEVAVGEIFRLKGRPATNPVIVHVGDLAQARTLSSHWTEQAERLAKSFWPGPLTLVVPASNEIPSIVRAGGGTVGLRLPGHPFMRSVCRSVPVAAPSANVSNQISPTTAEHVRRAFSDRIPLIVDGGPCEVGIESTVVDASVFPCKILRPGMITESRIEQALIGLEPVHDSCKSDVGKDFGIHKSPGLFPRHYSPRAVLVTVSWQSIAELEKWIEKHLGQGRCNPEQIHILAYKNIPDSDHWGRVCLLPNDPEAYGRALYSELHESDLQGAEWILVESPPQEEEWRAITDRLNRASARL